MNDFGRKERMLVVCLISLLSILAIVGIFPVLLGIAVTTLGAVGGLYLAFVGGNSFEHYSTDKLNTPQDTTSSSEKVENKEGSSDKETETSKGGS
jgi:membrane protein DedA with SNARE-associated domain